MKKYKLLSWVLSLVMALTVFSIPAGSVFANDGDDEISFAGNISVGGTFTLPAAEEDETIACVKINPVSKDTVVALQYEEGKISPTFNSTENQDVLEDLYSGEGNSPIISKLKAGKSYYIEVCRYDPTEAVTLSLEVYPIQSLSLQAETVLYENYSGVWATENTGETFFEYPFYLDSYLTDGDTLTVKYADGTQKVYRYKKISNENNEWEYMMEADDGEILIADDGFWIYANQYDDHWSVGSDNIAYIGYKGFRYPINVTVEPNPVAKVTVIPAEAYFVVEDDCWTETDSNGKKYTEYMVPSVNNKDKLTIEYNDGRPTETYVYYMREDVWKQVDGNKRLTSYEDLQWDDDQKTKHWSKGSSNNVFYLKYMGVRSNPLKVKIMPSVSKAKITLYSSTLVYTGDVRTPSVKSVKYGSTSLKKGTDYSFYAPKKKAIGTYWYEVTGINKYAGYKEGMYKIIPRKATILTPVAARKAITVKWKKQDRRMLCKGYSESRHIIGYRVQYSLNKSFSGAKTKYVRGYTNTAVTLKSLKAKRTYYVRIQTYIKDGYDHMYYSNWSSVKAVKTK